MKNRRSHFAAALLVALAGLGACSSTGGSGHERAALDDESPVRTAAKNLADGGSADMNSAAAALEEAYRVRRSGGEDAVRAEVAPRRAVTGAASRERAESGRAGFVRSPIVDDPEMLSANSAAAVREPRNAGYDHADAAGGLRWGEDGFVSGDGADGMAARRVGEMDVAGGGYDGDGARRDTRGQRRERLLAELTQTLAEDARQPGGGENAPLNSNSGRRGTTGARNAASAERGDPGDNDFQRAVRLALVEALTPAAAQSRAAGALESASATMGPQDAASLARVRDVLRGVGSAKEGAAAAKAVTQGAALLASASALTLPAVELCTRVDGFGRYTPVASTTLLAGRGLSAILYTEVENFTSVRDDTASGPQSASTAGSVAGTGAFVTNLSQTIHLYNDEGRAIWSLPPQTLRETARNIRRDYYLVQRIDLPANLAPGAYTLKTTVRDLARNAETQRGVPIMVVANRNAAAGVTK
ncbi:hypothetical protein BH11PLA1_BH11PLA1_12040 [soil metagenome]